MGAGFAAVRHPATTLGCCAVLMVASCWAALGMQINSYTLETFDAGHPAIRTIRIVEERLGGLLPVEIRMKSDEPGRFHTPEVYRKVAEVEQFAREQPAVLFARSYVDLHQEIDAETMKKDELRNILPPIGEEGQRRIDRSTRFIRKVQDELRYDAFVSDDGRQVRLLIRVRDVGTQRLVALFGDLETALEAAFPPGSGIDALITGDAYLNTRAMDTMIRDLVRSLFGASVVIFAIMAFVFRSLKLGLIASIPNVTPLVLTLGYMALRGYELNVGNVMVFTISLGVAVDNTIHFVFRVREELARDCTMREAIERAIMESGRAMVTTSFLIILGLVVLMFSDFVPTRRFAELTSVTMIGALIGDLMLLPACLVMFWRPKAKRRAEQAPAGSAPAAGRRLNEETASR
jgi:predicted RND superfamily exporter protein